VQVTIPRQNVAGLPRRSLWRRRVVATCCHPVARNVATLVPDNQRCNRCCHFSNFMYLLMSSSDLNPKNGRCSVLNGKVTKTQLTRPRQPFKLFKQRVNQTNNH
jgi:hypothetical protein